MVNEEKKGLCEDCFWAKEIIGSTMVQCMWFHNEVWSKSIGCSEWCSDSPLF